MSGHVEVLRELREICRAAIEAGDWKIDGACDPDSVLRRADAAIASLSAVGSGPVECDGLTEHEFRAVWLAASAEDRQLMRDEIAKIDGESAPAEAQPVGVEAGWYRYNKPAPRWEDTKFGKWLDPEVYGPPREQHGYSLEVAALAQQPVADMRDRLLAALERAAAVESELARFRDQQPAAVGDGETYPIPRNRQEAEALARLALAYLGAVEAHIDAAIDRCETAAALAAQEAPR